MALTKKNTQAEIKEQTGKKPLLFDINFDSQYKDCVKITGDGVVKYSDLFEFLFVLAKPEAQARMIPVVQELGNEYMKQIRIITTKDMKKGDELVVNVRVRVPELVEKQILKDLNLDNKGKKGI